MDSSELKALRIRSTVCSNWLKPFEREELALQRHQQLPRRNQRVDRQQAQATADNRSGKYPSGRPAPPAATYRDDGRDQPCATISTSAPDRSTVAASRSSRGTRVGTTASANDALPISTS